MNKGMCYLRNVVACLAAAAGLASCDWIHDDDLPPCPTGLEICFRYDYNLQRADLFNDHVRSVTAYVFDERGALCLKQTESGNALADAGYRMRLELKPGRYTYIALAGQKSVAEMGDDGRAALRLTEPSVGEEKERLSLALDLDAEGRVPHEGLPLDTLWHGMKMHPVEVVLDRFTTDTISLMRDTKQINVALRDLDRPEATDVADFDFRIYDRNTILGWDNAVDESRAVTYTPYATWNTTDKPTDATQTVPGGRMAHADFMTNRILFHDAGRDDAILSVVNRRTGAEVIRVNLADLLSRLRTSADIYRYSPQEFLDRGYDYQLTFFLKGDRWEFVNIEIGVLSWAKRIQYEHIQI